MKNRGRGGQLLLTRNPIRIPVLLALSLEGRSPPWRTTKDLSTLNCQPPLGRSSTGHGPRITLRGGHPSVLSSQPHLLFWNVKMRASPPVLPQIAKRKRNRTP